MCYICSIQTAEAFGVWLKIGAAVVLSTEDKSHPKFGIVKNLLMVDSELIVAIHVLEILKYSVHYHFWIEKESDRRSIIAAKSIPAYASTNKEYLLKTLLYYIEIFSLK